MNTNKNKSRTLINLLGLPSVLFIVYQGGILFQLFICLVMFLALKEFSNLMKIKSYSINSSFLYFIIPITLFSNTSFFNNFIYNSFDNKFGGHNPIGWSVDFIVHLMKMDFIGILIILIIFIWEIFRVKKTPFENIAATIFALIWIISFLDMSISIRNYHFNGYEFTLCMLLSVWACDSAAFYFGSKFGNKKILPQISPNKTWVGTFAGYLSATLIVFLFEIFYKSFLDCNIFTYFDILILGTIFGIIGQLGDFFESMIKRELNIKDSGTILQGHGGVLDRFDSLLFVIPAFYLFLLYKFPIL